MADPLDLQKLSEAYESVRGVLTSLDVDGSSQKRCDAIDLVWFTISQILADCARLRDALGEARADVVKMAQAKIGHHCGGELTIHWYEPSHWMPLPALPAAPQEPETK